jgi:Zn-dependent protease with chaperone function
MVGGKSSLASWKTRIEQALGASSYLTPLLTQFVFLLIVAYYAALIVLCMHCIYVDVLFYRGFLLMPWSNLPSLAFALLFSVLIVRLTVELLLGIVGLVTSKYDGTTPPVFGPLMDEANAPELRLLIDDVGRRTKGPQPHEVRVSPNAECYVFENRRFALSTNRCLVLVVGLPHLAVLTAAELKVILTHELAHFAGGDTRLGVFLHRFLESLRDRTEQSPLGIWRWLDPIYWFRYAYFTMSRFVAAPVWRSQELRADAASARAFGGRLTARTLLREWLLAEQFAEQRDLLIASDANSPLRKRNLYDVFAEQFRRVTPEGEQYLRRRLADEQELDAIDSHPTMRARIDLALSFPDREPPDTRPARRLIRDFHVVKEQMQSELINLGQ